MATLAFDTLAFSKKLRGHFTPEQAETLAEAFVAGADEQLATKVDLRELESRLEPRFAHVDARFSQLETRIAESTNKTILWTVGSMLSISALVVALIKLIP